METGIEGLISTLQCVVCLETAHKPPIFQCSGGHLLCQDCNQRIKECPSCGNTLQNTRHKTAEEMAEKLKACKFNLYIYHDIYINCHYWCTILTSYYKNLLQVRMSVTENLIQGHDEMPNHTIDINIPEYQTIKQGWSKVLSYKIDISILEEGQLCPNG